MGDTGSSTAGETVAPTTEGPEPVGCERIAGGDGVDWYLRCGGASDEYVHGVGVDGAGDLLVAVELRTLDPAPPFMIGEFEVVPGEVSDILLIKLSGEGEVLSVKHITGPGNQYIQAVTVCDDGFVIAGGAPAGTDLGGGPLADEDFIASFDGEGAHRWSRSVPILAESGHIIVSDLACDEAGSLVVAGSLRGGIDLGGGPLMPMELYDGFVARYDAAGAFEWSLPFGSTGDSAVLSRGVALAPDGGVAVVGSFDEQVDLGGGPLTASEGDDVLVARLAADGTHVWSRQIGVEGLQYGQAVAVDSAGRVAVSGAFLDEIEIGADTYTNVFIEAEEEVDGTLYDGFVALYDGAGELQWSEQIGSMLDDDVRKLVYDASDKLVVRAFTGQQLVVRVYTDTTQSAEWGTDQLLAGDIALLGEEAVVLGGTTRDGFDLGAGLLAPRGEADMVLARVRR